MFHHLINFHGYHNTDWFNAVPLAAIIVYLFLDLVEFLSDSVTKGVL